MGRRLPPLNAVRAFEAAARHLSFTKAADELNVTQASVVGAMPAWRRLRGMIVTRPLQGVAPQ